MKDYTGQVFNGIRAMRDVGSNGKRRLWEFKCTCGSLFTTIPRNVEIGHTRSCGCLPRAPVFPPSEKSQRTPLEQATYYAWWHMVDRCHNPNSQSYSYYGARGIYVCECWKTFKNFLSDMGAKPEWELSLEREDNDGPYCKENCKWATKSEQNKNKRYATSSSIRHYPLFT